MSLKYVQQFKNEGRTEDELRNVLPRRYKASAMDKVTFLMQKIGDQIIHFIVEYTKHIDERYFQEAIRQAVMIEPILMCNFIIDKKNAYWQLSENFSYEDLWSLVETRNVTEELEKFIHQDLDVQNDIPTHIRIIRSKNQDLLCLKASHAAMDAAAMQEYLSLIVEIYNKLIVQPDCVVEMVETKNYDRGLKQILRNFSIRKRITARRREITPEHTWAFPWVGIDATTKNYSLLRISTKSFDQMKKYGQERNATINDILLTAYYRAMFTLVKPNYNEPMTNTVTINLRTYLPENKAQAICNLSVGVFTTIANREDDSFEDTLVQVRNQMNKIKAKNPGIGITFTLELALRIMNYPMLKKYTEKITREDIAQKKTHPIFTNIGVIKGERFTFTNTEVSDGYFITPIMSAPGYILGISTFNKVMTISFGFYEGSYNKKDVDKFLRLMKDELPK